MHVKYAVTLALLLFACGSAIAAPELSVREADGSLEILANGQSIAKYVYADPEIPRPYFAHVKTFSGVQVTRNHPPGADDPDDHATYHPGIWLAFGDISGADFWRNRAEVRHVKFIASPETTDGVLSFTVENAYLDGTQIICRERCTYQIIPQGDTGWMLVSDSTFENLVQPVYFGDQEEMGFGVRLATPLAVLHGGTILNSAGAKNEEEVWGRQAQWADYRGMIDGQPAGVALFAHSGNFRASWFHARDYGLLVANPFGQNAFTQGEKSKVPVTAEDPLRLRFAAFIHEELDDAVLRKVYEQFVAEPADNEKEP